MHSAGVTRRPQNRVLRFAGPAGRGENLNIPVTSISLLPVLIFEDWDLLKHRFLMQVRRLRMLQTHYSERTANGIFYLASTKGVTNSWASSQTLPLVRRELFFLPVSWTTLNSLGRMHCTHFYFRVIALPFENSLRSDSYSRKSQMSAPRYILEGISNINPIVEEYTVLEI